MWTSAWRVPGVQSTTRYQESQVLLAVYSHHFDIYLRSVDLHAHLSINHRRVSFFRLFNFRGRPRPQNYFHSEIFPIYGKLECWIYYSVRPSKIPLFSQVPHQLCESCSCNLASKNLKICLWQESYDISFGDYIYPPQMRLVQSYGCKHAVVLKCFLSCTCLCNSSKWHLPCLSVSPPSQYCFSASRFFQLHAPTANCPMNSSSNRVSFVGGPLALAYPPLDMLRILFYM